MGKLKSKLENFHPESEGELDGLFEDLAKSFLYGGYISVKDNKDKERYRIYLRTVEFYCHCEDENSSLPKDPIVYHRDGRYVEGEVPYFPLMAFHAHASGYDITFEKEELKLRSSALIRAYEVYDVQRKAFLVYDRAGKIFKACDKGKNPVNTQSTYLYNFLNGFMGNSVSWVDDVRKEEKFDIKLKERRNVFKYNGEVKTQDPRQWSFTRQEEISVENLKK